MIQEVKRNIRGESSDSLGQQNLRAIVLCDVYSLYL
jgi:hypothetical protein